MSKHTCGECERFEECEYLKLRLKAGEWPKFQKNKRAASVRSMPECPARTSERQKDEEIKRWKEGLEEIANKCGYVTVDELQELARYHLNMIPRLLQSKGEKS